MREWNAISRFSHNLGVKEEIIKKAEQDFKELLKRYSETREFVWEEHKSKLNESLSMQNFQPWWANLLCFFLLFLSVFRHAALRELRSYLEVSERSYYIDSRHHEKSYEDKVKILKLFKLRKTEEDITLLKTILGKKQESKIGRKINFKELLWGIPPKKRNELVMFYSDLCEHVHLSEQAQSDALKDFGLNLALRHPCYKEDIEMLEKTFECSRYLLLKSLEKPTSL